MQGELLAITDPSGCGKTTLLQMLGALDRPTAGTLLYRGKSIPNLPDPSNYRTREIGFIFQAFHLLPTFTALENVQIPMLETEIIEFDGKSVTDSRHLRLMVAEKPPGSNVSVKVFRDGKEQTFTVELGTLPSEDLFQPGGSSDAWR
jgi:ABC-type lipoprotein export system ATPase subunit